MEARSQEPGAESLVAYIDGASRGNPGPASYGVVIQDAAGHPLHTMAQHLGRATNNVAEWSALVAALEFALSRRAGQLRVYCDSELVARQMQGRYRVLSPDLKPYFEKARGLASRIGRFSIENVPRALNHEADRLANQALDAVRRGGAAKPATPPASNATETFLALAEGGKLRPLAPLPDLEDGAVYDVRASKRKDKA